MTVKFTKEIEATGDVWYKIYIDGEIKATKRDQLEARRIYETIVMNAQSGMMGEETIEETIINPK